MKAPKEKLRSKKPGEAWAVGLLSLYLFLVTAGAALGAYHTWPVPQASAQASQQSERDAGESGGEKQTESGAEKQPDRRAQSGSQSAASETKPGAEPTSELDKERRLARFVLYLGILGACLHAMTSVSTYAGNNTFERSWITWYLLRPLIGGVLAWFVFLVFRGGFLGGVDITAVNPYAFGALGALSGMFSKRVIDKLSELIETIFRMPQGQGDDLRKDKLAAPTLTVQPDQLSASRETTTLTITGAGFKPNAVVKVGDVPLKPDNVEETKLTVDVPIEAYIGRDAVDVAVLDGVDGAVLGKQSIKVVK